MPENKKQPKILIVEDEKPLSRAMKLKLENSGFLVEVATNGQEAIDLVKKDQFDAMILDLVMPIMDGFAVLEELKKNKIKLPIIAASNLAQREDIDRAKALGADSYFIKSNTSLAQIVEHVRKATS